MNNKLLKIIGSIVLICSFTFFVSCSNREVSNIINEIWKQEYVKYLNGIKDSPSDYVDLFGLFDINNDGIPELFISGQRSYQVISHDGGELYVAGKILLTPFVTFKENSIFTYGGVGTGAASGFLYTMENGKLIEKEIFALGASNNQISYYYDDNNVAEKVILGETIPENQYDQLLSEYEVKPIEMHWINQTTITLENINSLVTKR